MTTVVNRNGKVKIGANLIASIESFSYETSNGIIEEPDLADTWVPGAAGRSKFRGTLECKFDYDDTNGQEAMTAGAAVTLDYLPEGDTLGDRRVQADVIVETVGVAVPNEDGFIKRTFAVVGADATGPTFDTVP
jgi:hypothetical protein